MEDPEQYSRMKTAFYNKMEEIINEKNINNQIFTQGAYLSMIAKVEHAKGLKFGKTPSDYARLKKFDVLEIDGCKRLVVPFFCSSSSSGNKTSGSIRMFVYVDEIFDILHTAHLKIGHKRRNGMLQEVNQFKNITREMIHVYLGVCEYCNEKIASKTQEKEQNISCIDFIRMPTDKYGNNLIFVHIDFKTQFVQLRLLKNTDAQEVTRALLDIFSIFGPPEILQGNISNALGEKLVADLFSNCSDFKTTFIKTEGKVELLEEATVKIIQLFNTWMESNRTLEWSDGLKFVQLMKNKEYNKTLTRSAGEAMFGNRFGRTMKKKKTNELIDKTTSNEKQETFIAVGETSLEIGDTQNLQDLTDESTSAKRIKVEQEPGDSNKIIIQKIEIVEHGIVSEIIDNDV